MSNFNVSQIINEKLNVEITGKNISDATQGSASMLKDNNGNFVLRTVDAAPTAYDAGTNRQRVQVENVADIRQVGMYIAREKIGNYSVNAGASLRIPLPELDCHETSILIRIANGEVDHEVTIKLNPAMDGKPMPAYGEEILPKKATQNQWGFSKKHTLFTTLYEVNLTNHDTTTHNYDVYVNKFFNARG